MDHAKQVESGSPEPGSPDLDRPDLTRPDIPYLPTTDRPDPAESDRPDWSESDGLDTVESGRPVPPESDGLDTPEPRRLDPLAVAVANASLLGVGYLMMRRRLTAAVTGIVTVALVVVLVSVVSTVWFEVVVDCWWAAMITHGWGLANRENRENPADHENRRVVIVQQRYFALCFALPVLLALGVLRFDIARIDDTTANARHRGNCTKALTAVNEVWIGDRIADAPLAKDLDHTGDACRRLKTAQSELATALTGDTNTQALEDAFADMEWVLSRRPGHTRLVRTVLDGFMHDVTSAAPCQTAAISDWLHQRPPSQDLLDETGVTGGRIAPAALVSCGDSLLAGEDWNNAKAQYQRVLDNYPGNPLTSRAQDGIRKATLASELANVRGLLADSGSDRPQYCSTPVAYEGAPAYGKGVNKALFYGNSAYTDRLPGQWKASDVSDAVLVVCADTDGMGPSVDTCPYYNKEVPDGNDINVTFHKIAIPVKAYELRTGKLVFDAKVQISGSSCPHTLHYSASNLNQNPPPDVYVNASDSDVRDAFAPVITP